MTESGFPSHLIRRELQFFYTLTKIHKPTLVGRPIISGCDSPTERISSFVDRLVQRIAQSRDSYLKDRTDFINFLPADVILVSVNGRH